MYILPAFYISINEEEKWYNARDGAYLASIRFWLGLFEPGPAGLHLMV